MLDNAKFQPTRFIVLKSLAEFRLKDKTELFTISASSNAEPFFLTGHAQKSLLPDEII